MQTSDNSLVIVSGPEIQHALAGREEDVLHAVREAYVLHEERETSLPHSTFLRFPDSPLNRIIALPGWLGGSFSVAGMKWISSFPANVEKGMARASAVLVLNCTETGRAFCVMEGSIVSAKRTAASAALASRILSAGRSTEQLTVIGCGPINREVIRFLLHVHGAVTSIVAFDTIRSRAETFCMDLEPIFCGTRFTVAESISDAIGAADVVSFATNSVHPHLTDAGMLPRGCVVLHVSLRDLAPEVLLNCENVVDDVDHVCRANTSVHLAEQRVGSRSFIRCTLGALLRGCCDSELDRERPIVFSPFGLGVLDLAVGKLAYNLAHGSAATGILDFFPDT